MSNLASAPASRSRRADAERAARRPRAPAGLARGAALVGVVALAVPSIAPAASGFESGGVQISPPLARNLDAASATVEDETMIVIAGPPRGKMEAPSAVSAAIISGERPLCVRLCDGYFFPLPVISGDDASAEAARCSSLCPNAPTAVYFETGSPDAIDSAVSMSGTSYSALPAAFSYRTRLSRVCACRGAADAGVSIARDRTLRPNDLVMTENGFRVFRGSSRMPYDSGAFAAPAASDYPADRRAMLAAMERASLMTANERPPASPPAVDDRAPEVTRITEAAPPARRARIEAQN